MSKQSALRLVDAIADDARGEGRASPEMHAQVAFIRALVDEVERHHPADRWLPALHEQLADELLRLAQIVKRGRGPLAPEVSEDPIDVLVVDDDESARRIMLAVLRHLGYPGRAAADGEAALREFDREASAIVVTDWSMPGMSGLDLCSALKQRELAPYVIVVTAYHDNACVLEGGCGRVDDFLQKPIDFDDLESRLAAASRFVGALRSLARLNDRLSEEHRMASCA